MDLSTRPALDYAWDEMAQLMTSSFAEYFVSIQMTPSSLAALCVSEGVDMRHSRVALREDEPVGLGLIARRGWTCRLAAMGVVVAARRSGVGRALLSTLIHEAKARGDRRMVLEVIEQNAPAIRLYERAGFRIQRRLVGFHASPLQGGVDPDLRQVDPLRVAHAVFAHAAAGLPWQLAPETLVHYASPHEGFQLQQAYAVISDPAQPTVALRALLVEPAGRRRGQARHLLQALFGCFPGKHWRVPILVPEGPVTGLFTGMGFQRETLSQFEMSLEL